MPTHDAIALAELPPGSMRAVELGGTEVLLCNVDGAVSALHPRCTHYGAPLADGVLNGHRLVCPWHHACFDARDGRHLEAPGCDALHSYPVEIREGRVHVVLPEGPSGDDGQHPNPMTAPAEAGPAAPYVVLGGGPAGQHCVEGLRQGGYAGPITLVSAETRVPYDRTQVSKGFLTGDRDAAQMPLRDEEFYRRLGVELRLGERAEALDVSAKTVTLADGGRLRYRKLCIATGSSPRRLDVPGAQLPAIYELRDWDDAEAVRQAAGEGKHAVVVGASFIGMEAAMALAKLGCRVTVVAPDEVPFGKTLGTRIGRTVQGWHEADGVQFRLGEHVVGFEGVRKVTGVRLKSGDTLRAHLVVVGIGVEPNLGFVPASAFARRDGGIVCDARQYAGHDVWVAGDVAAAPQGVGGAVARVEHWRVAEQQGTVAGNAMAGARRTLMSVPYFWTNQAGKNLRYAGHLDGEPDQVVFDGDPAGGPFIAFYVRGDRVAAAVGHGRDRELAAIHELMWLGAMPAAEELRMGEDWVRQLAR